LLAVGKVEGFLELWMGFLFEGKVKKIQSWGWMSDKWEKKKNGRDGG
jgi:hypothetical protein